MEAHQPCSRILRAEAIFHQAIPDFARCAKFRDLFEEVVMGIEKEAQTRAELIDVQSSPPRPLDVLHAVIDRECQLLKRGRSRFADVIAADRNRVEPWREMRSELESI